MSTSASLETSGTEPIEAIRPVSIDVNAATPTLVLIHGLFSSPLEFSLVTRWLGARGVRFELLEVAGYTRGGTIRSTWRQWIAAARAALESRFEPDEPIVVGGLCVGAALAAALVETPCRPSIHGLVMLSPALRIDGWGVTRWRRLRSMPFLFGLDRWIEVREREPYGIKNIKLRHWIRRELETNRFSSIGPARTPLWGVREADRLSAHVRRGLNELDVPLLVIHARDDEIASLAGVRRWMQDVHAPKQLVVLDDSYHMLTMDNDRRAVARCLAEFLGSDPDWSKLAGASARGTRHPTQLRTEPTRPSDLIVRTPSQPPRAAHREATS